MTQYALSFLVTFLRALFWPPGWFGRMVQLAVWAILVGLYIEPEWRMAAEVVMQDYFGLSGIEGWHFLMFAAGALIVGLGSRIAYAEISPIRFLPLEPPQNHRLYCNVFVPIQNVGLSEKTCVARLYIVDEYGRRATDDLDFPVILMTRRRYMDNDRSILPFILRREPKSLFILSYSRHDDRYRFGPSYVGPPENDPNTYLDCPGVFRFEISVETGSTIAIRQFAVTKMDGLRIRISDGYIGYEYPEGTD